MGTLTVDRVDESTKEAKLVKQQSKKLFVVILLGLLAIGVSTLAVCWWNFDMTEHQARTWFEWILVLATLWSLFGSFMFYVFKTWSASSSDDQIEE